MSRALDTDVLYDLHRPDAHWRLEEAKLLWAQGQSSLALQLLHAVIAALSARSASLDQDSMLHAQLLILSGKWLAHTRYMPYLAVGAQLDSLIVSCILPF